MATYKTIDLLNEAYNDREFPTRLQNIKTGEVIRQDNKHFYNKDGSNFLPNKLNPIELDKWLQEEWKIAQVPINFLEAFNIGITNLFKIKPNDDKYNKYEYVNHWISLFPRLPSNEMPQLIKGEWLIEERKWGNTSCSTESDI